MSIELPFIMKVCSKDKDEREKIVKNLGGGTWLNDNVVAITGRGPTVLVRLPTIKVAKFLHPEIEPCAYFNISEAAQNHGGDLLNHSISLSGAWYTTEHCCGISPAISGKKILSVVDSVRGQNFERYVLVPIVKGPNHPYLNNEFVYCLMLLLRFEFRLSLVQIVRIINRNIKSGYISAESLLNAAERLENKFVIAAVKLATRGFKSKRFKPRPLKQNELVRYYYDNLNFRHNTSIKSPVGTVMIPGTADNGLPGKVRVYITAERREKDLNYGFGNKYDVYPLTL